TCAAPCYQVRMFIEDRLGELQIQAFQMNVGVYAGAVPAVLPVPPATNGNAGSGNIKVRLSTGTMEFLPWNLSSTVGKSPNGDAIVVDAAENIFNVASLVDQVNAPGTTCIDDPAKCDLVLDALSRSRIYLGYFNITRTETPIGHP